MAPNEVAPANGRPVGLVRLLAGNQAGDARALLKCNRDGEVSQGGKWPMAEQEIGRISHYYSNIGVAAIELDKGGLKVGDTIHIKGHTTDLTEPIESMQIEHETVEEAKQGDAIGVKVSDHVREHDTVFKVTD